MASLTQIQLCAAVKVPLGFESQFLLKCLFLIVFSKIYRLAKVDVLGTWEVGILLTPYVPKMAAKLMSLYLSSSFNKLACHLVEAFETIPVVS